MERKAAQSILAHLSKKQITVITGARQVGKTTLLQQIQAEIQKKHGQCVYVSLENPSALASFSEHPENLFSVVPRPSKKDRVFVLIDEIQYLPDPTNFMKYLYDTYAPNLKLIVTGSSAFYIDQHFKDSMAGRKKIFILDPLDFEEYLTFSNNKSLAKEIALITLNQEYESLKKPELMQAFEQYLIFGGYPEVVLEPNKVKKIELLKELQNSFMRKDMLESKVEEQEKFYLLARLLANQAGSLVNKAELANTLQLNERTVERYLYILQKCFHIQLLKPWHSNLRKEISKMPKVFFNDTGLRNQLTRDFELLENRLDKGLLFEHFVYYQLRKKYDRDADLYFWRTAEKNEVDFIVETGNNKGLAYECKWNEKEFKPSKYKKFNELYGSNFELNLLSVEYQKLSNWIFKMK